VVLPAGLTELMLNCGIFCGNDIQQHMASSPLKYLQLRWVGHGDCCNSTRLSSFGQVLVSCAVLGVTWFVSG
jgi:hypothetical protein